jgi:hypothetical protein
MSDPLDPTAALRRAQMLLDSTAHWSNEDDSDDPNAALRRAGELLGQLDVLPPMTQTDEWNRIGGLSPLLTRPEGPVPVTPAQRAEPSVLDSTALSRAMGARRGGVAEQIMPYLSMIGIRPAAIPEAAAARVNEPGAIRPISEFPDYLATAGKRAVKDVVTMPFQMAGAAATEVGKDAGLVDPATGQWKSLKDLKQLKPPPQPQSFEEVGQSFEQMLQRSADPFGLLRALVVNPAMHEWQLGEEALPEGTTPTPEAQAAQLMHQLAAIVPVIGPMVRDIAQRGLTGTHQEAAEALGDVAALPIMEEVYPRVGAGAKRGLELLGDLGRNPANAVPQFLAATGANRVRAPQNAAQALAEMKRVERANVATGQGGQRVVDHGTAVRTLQAAMDEWRGDTGVYPEILDTSVRLGHEWDVTDLGQAIREVADSYKRADVPMPAALRKLDEQARMWENFSQGGGPTTGRLPQEAGATTALPRRTMNAAELDEVLQELNAATGRFEELSPQAKNRVQQSNPTMAAQVALRKAVREKLYNGLGEMGPGIRQIVEDGQRRWGQMSEMQKRLVARTAMAERQKVSIPSRVEQIGRTAVRMGGKAAIGAMLGGERGAMSLAALDLAENELSLRGARRKTISGLLKRAMRNQDVAAPPFGWQGPMHGPWPATTGPGGSPGGPGGGSPLGGGPGGGGPGGGAGFPIAGGGLPPNPNTVVTSPTGGPPAAGPIIMPGESPVRAGGETEPLPPEVDVSEARPGIDWEEMGRRFTAHNNALQAAGQPQLTWRQFMKLVQKGGGGEAPPAAGVPVPRGPAPTPGAPPAAEALAEPRTGVPATVARAAWNRMVELFPKELPELVKAFRESTGTKPKSKASKWASQTELEGPLADWLLSDMATRHSDLKDYQLLLERARTVIRKATPKPEAPPEGGAPPSPPAPEGPSGGPGAPPASPAATPAAGARPAPRASREAAGAKAEEAAANAKVDKDTEAAGLEAVTAEAQRLRKQLLDGQNAARKLSKPKQAAYLQSMEALRHRYMEIVHSVKRVFGQEAQDILQDVYRAKLDKEAETPAPAETPAETPEQAPARNPLAVVAKRLQTGIDSDAIYGELTEGMSTTISPFQVANLLKNAKNSKFHAKAREVGARLIREEELGAKGVLEEKAAKDGPESDAAKALARMNEKLAQAQATLKRDTEALKAGKKKPPMSDRSAAIVKGAVAEREAAAAETPAETPAETTFKADPAKVARIREVGNRMQELQAESLRIIAEHKKTGTSPNRDLESGHMEYARLQKEFTQLHIDVQADRDAYYTNKYGPYVEPTKPTEPTPPTTPPKSKASSPEAVAARKARRDANWAEVEKSAAALKEETGVVQKHVARGAAALNRATEKLGRTPKATLPRDLAGAKPRYNIGPNEYHPTFDSDIDKAAYITAQKKPSLRDADYLKFVQRETGWSEAAVRAHGAKVRAALKEAVKDADEEGRVTLPDQMPDQSNPTAPVPKSKAAKARAEAQKKSPAAAVTPKPPDWKAWTPEVNTAIERQVASLIELQRKQRGKPDARGYAAGAHVVSELLKDVRDRGVSLEDAKANALDDLRTRDLSAPTRAIAAKAVDVAVERMARDRPEAAAVTATLTHRFGEATARAVRAMLEPGEKWGPDAHPDDIALQEASAKLLHRMNGPNVRAELTPREARILADEFRSLADSRALLPEFEKGNSPNQSIRYAFSNFADKLETIAEPKPPAPKSKAAAARAAKPLSSPSGKLLEDYIRKHGGAEAEGPTAPSTEPKSERQGEPTPPRPALAEIRDHLLKGGKVRWHDYGDRVRTSYLESAEPNKNGTHSLTSDDSGTLSQTDKLMELVKGLRSKHRFRKPVTLIDAPTPLAEQSATELQNTSVTQLQAQADVEGKPAPKSKAAAAREAKAAADAKAARDAEIDDVFAKPDPKATKARMTKEIRHELQRILDEFDAQPYQGRTFTPVPREHNYDPDAQAGGKYYIQAGHEGAPVFHDIRNQTPVVRRKGKLTEGTTLTRKVVEDAVRQLLDTGTVTRPIHEGALRVAELRAAGAKGKSGFGGGISKPIIDAWWRERKEPVPFDVPKVKLTPEEEAQAARDAEPLKGRAAREREAARRAAKKKR